MDTPARQPSSVAATVWRWRQPAGAVAVHGAADVRKRALIQFLVAAAIAGIFYFWFKWQHMAVIVLGVATCLLAFGLAHPPLFAAVERLLQRFGNAVGTALTWALLVPFFYLVFAPGRLILRMTGRDPMNRKFPTSEPTYWIDYRRATGEGHHSRQYR